MEIVNSINEKDLEKIRIKKDEFDAKYDKERLNENIISQNLEGYGLTIVSLIKYCDSVGLNCVPEFIIDKKPCFKVTIYFYNN